MERLTIKELAPYLPYKLQWVFEGSDDVHEVVGLDITDFGVHIISPYGDSGRCSVKDGKPILRPLSYLTEEIEHNGERFVPVDVLGWNSYENIIKKGICDSVGYQYMIKLLEWHFDVFGLTHRGLAIPIDGKGVKS